MDSDFRPFRKAVRGGLGRPMFGPQTLDQAHPGFVGSASFEPSLPRSTYAFKGPLNYMDAAAGVPRGGRIPYSEYMAGARPAGATRSRAGYKKSAPKKRTYKAKTTRLKPGLSVKDYGQARLKRGSKFTLANYGETFSKGTKRQKANRKKYGYTGRGKYSFSGMMAQYKNPAFWKGVKKGVQKGVGYGADIATYGANALAVGATAAAFAGLPEFLPYAVEAEVLAADARFASNYIGRGLYIAKHGMNDLIAGGSSSVPTMMSVPDETGSIIVSHTERVADIIAPADDKFHVQSFTVQAGLEETFPWLHQMASAYEEYEMLQCVFQYKGHDIVGIQNTLDLQGQVIAATKYNVKSKSFTDRHEMQAYPHAASCSLNGSLQSGVESAPGKIAGGDTHRYIRTGGLESGEDVTDYDHARFELALNNTPTDLFNKEVGQLFVFYTIKLSKPKLFAGRGKAISIYRQFSKTGHASKPFGLAADDTDITSGDADQFMTASKNSLLMKYVSQTNNNPYWDFPSHANGRYRCQFVVQDDAVNLDHPAVDFGVPEAYGNVTLCSLFPGRLSTSEKYWHTANRDYATGGTTGLVDNNRMSILEFEVVVRPQTGATKNRIQLNMLFAETGDTVTRSAIRIEEMNDMGTSALEFPEIIGNQDGLVKALS